MQPPAPISVFRLLSTQPHWPLFLPCCHTARAHTRAHTRTPARAHTHTRHATHEETHAATVKRTKANAKPRSHQGVPTPSLELIDVVLSISMILVVSDFGPCWE